MKLSDRDKKLIWHPFTQEKTSAPVIAVKRAEGAYIYDENDKAYLDLISSWWVNIHGHANSVIANSIAQQAMKLEHVIFAGFTHEPAVLLCEELHKVLPNTLCKFFFSDNGSTSVEVALKMAYQYFRNNGDVERNIFISFEGGYHGDTFGAMSVGIRSGFHSEFKELFFDVITLPYPSTWDNDEEVEAKETEVLNFLDQQLLLVGSKVAALVIEPLVQGASGMRICRPEFVRQVITKVRQYGILVIFDEVMTGFYRTGALFALDRIGIAPDILCLSKGITGGFLPLALTIATQDIYNAFLGDDFARALAHGHSYTANPIACSAALASLQLLLTENCKNSVKQIERTHLDGLSLLSEKCPRVIRSRVIGTIGAFDLDLPLDIISKLKAQFLENGLLLRPLRNTVYLLPPYCTKEDELYNAYQTISKLLVKL